MKDKFNPPPGIDVVTKLNLVKHQITLLAELTFTKSENGSVAKTKASLVSVLSASLNGSASH